MSTTATTDIFAQLAVPFEANEIDWRVGQSGKTKDGKYMSEADALKAGYRASK